MYIISNYSISFNETQNIYYVIVDSNPCCLDCGSSMIHYDSRKRIRRYENGSFDYIRVRRLYCSSCKKYHTELPDELIPYKHYRADIIEGVLEDIIHDSDPDSDKYPSTSTMDKWILWFKAFIKAAVRFLNTYKPIYQYGTLDGLKSEIQMLKNQALVRHMYWLPTVTRILNRLRCIA